MRDLAKSMLSFTWSMSVFGLSQAANLLSPGQAASAFDEVARRTGEQLGPSSRQIFGVGDNLQRGFVDLAFRAFGLGLFDGPSGSRGARQSSGQHGCDSGWGPMPPIPPGT